MTDLKTLIYVIEQRISIAERNNQAFIDLPYDTVGDVLALLKEQEHKDRMFHALEEDWKKLKEQDVVRCKDCKNFRSENYVAPCKKVMRSEDADENWFCADGERRTDDA